MTAGVTYKQVRAEVSGFHGRGPDADRIAIEQGAIDSWSTRVTASPAPNWVFQVSGGHLTSPDALLPNQDVRRITGSVAYTRPIPGGYLVSTFGWGRDAHVGTSATYDSYPAEATFERSGHIVWGRAEAAERFVAAVIGGVHHHGPGTLESYTVGYAREVRLARFLETAVGAQLTSYKTPSLIAPAFGSRPVAVTVFLRIRPNGR